MKLPSSLQHSVFNLNTFVIAFILILSFFLRILGIGVGLPDTPDPRESLIAQEILNLIKLNAIPEIYNWPGTAWFYLIALIGKVLSLFGMGMNESQVIWLARFTNVCISTATVWLTYTLGEKCYNRRVGEIAAAFLTVTMLHVTNESRFALVDIPATFCVTLFLWLAVRDLDLSNRTCLWLGIVAGIGLAVKFPTILVCIPLLIFLKTDNIYRKYGTIFGVAAITFTILCPYWLIDLFSKEWNEFFQDFRYEAAHYHMGHFGLFASGNTGWGNRFLYLWTLLKWGMGLPLAMLIGFGLFYRTARLIALLKSKTDKPITDERMRFSLLFLAFVIPYLIFIGTFKVSFTRHLLIIYPVLIILASTFLFFLGKRYGSFIGSIAWLYSFIYTVAFASVMLSQPTTQETSEWISENIPIDSEISHAPEMLFDWLLPELDRDYVDFDDDPDWVLILNQNREVFQKYQMHPEKFQRQDWYPLREIDIQGNLVFYRSVLGKGSQYQLYRTFKRRPQFLGINVSDSGAPFPITALLHPTITMYRRSKK